MRNYLVISPPRHKSDNDFRYGKEETSLVSRQGDLTPNYYLQCSLPSSFHQTYLIIVRLEKGKCRIKKVSEQPDYIYQKPKSFGEMRFNFQNPFIYQKRLIILKDSFLCDI